MRPIFMTAAVMTALPACAAAQSADVPFNGTVVPTCTIVTGTPGTLLASAQGDVLSSVDGVSGTAAVTATGIGYEVTIDPPLGFDLAPTGGDADTSYTATFEASGATVAATANAGVPVSLLVGLTTVSVDVEARKSAGVFPAGVYRLVTTVRCTQP